VNEGIAFRRAFTTRALGLLTGAGLTCAAALLLLLPGNGSPSLSPTPAGQPLPEAVSRAQLVERSGVRITQLDATGGGGLLDLRYQVVDPGPAAAVHAPETPPAIVDQKTGMVIDSLLMGHQHTGQLHAAQTYYLVFNNPGNVVRSGDRVSVVLGDALVDDVRVR
jgi:hypothetical protein